MIRVYKLNNQITSLDAIMEYLEDLLTYGGNTSAFEDLGIDFEDLDVDGVYYEVIYTNPEDEDVEIFTNKELAQDYFNDEVKKLKELAKQKNYRISDDFDDYFCMHDDDFGGRYCISLEEYNDHA